MVAESLVRSGDTVSGFALFDRIEAEFSEIEGVGEIRTKLQREIVAPHLSATN
jgi:hypothetical protein